MKNLKYLILIIPFLLLVGCESDYKTNPNPIIVTEVDSSNIKGSMQELNYKGHEYLLWEGYRMGSLIHSESCSCKKKE